MSTYRERYTPLVVGLNSSGQIASDMVGVFIAATAGTLTLVNSAGQTILNAQPVAVGTNFIQLYLGANGGTYTLAGGASGTFGV